MSSSALPKELRESVRSTGQFVSKAILISPHKVEGTAIFDQKGEQPGICGSFIPTHAKITISENERCQLLLGKSNIVLNVRMSPGRSETGDAEHFRFEVAVWEAME